MPLSKVIVGGFKSIRNTTEIPIAPLTLLFGPNSAGTSAVLAAIDELARRWSSVDVDSDEWRRAFTHARKVLGDSGGAHQLPRKSPAIDTSYSPITLGAEAKLNTRRGVLPVA